MERSLLKVERFDALLSVKMYDVMKETFGESASTLIYSLMERQTSLKREEIGKKIEAFQTYLKRLVGPEATQIILATGLKQLYGELRREYEEVEKYFSLLDELYEVKFRLLASFQKEERSVSN